MAKLAHISDLHFGAADRAALENLAAAINEEAPDAIVATGDITQSGRRREFVEAAAYFKNFKSPLMIVPGNHDAPVYNPIVRFSNPWRRFRRFLSAEPGAVLDVKNARVVGLNSARSAGPSLDWSRGRLSEKQIEEASAAAKKAKDGCLRVVALHHPIEAAAGRAGRAVVGRAADALKAFLGAGVDLILTGHVHISRVRIFAGSSRGLVIASAGTASSTRQRGEAPSFNLIDGDRAALSVAIRRFSEGRYDECARHCFTQGDAGWRDAAAT